MAVCTQAWSQIRGITGPTHSGGLHQRPNPCAGGRSPQTTSPLTPHPGLTLWLYVDTELANGGSKICCEPPQLLLPLHTAHGRVATPAFACLSSPLWLWGWGVWAVPCPWQTDAVRAGDCLHGPASKGSAATQPQAQLRSVENPGLLMGASSYLLPKKNHSHKVRHRIRAVGRLNPHPWPQ